MKNFFFLIAFVFATTILQAQNENIQKGTWMAGGSITFSNTTQIQGNNSITNTNFSLDPQAGYFLSPRFALTLGASLSTSKFPSGTANALVFMPGARMYLYKGLFASAQVGIGHQKVNADANSIAVNLFSYEGGIGYSIFLNKHVAIEPALIYRSNNFDQIGASNGFTRSERLLNFSVGFRIFL